MIHPALNHIGRNTPDFATKTHHGRYNFKSRTCSQICHRNAAAFQHVCQFAASAQAGYVLRMAALLQANGKVVPALFRHHLHPARW